MGLTIRSGSVDAPRRTELRAAALSVLEAHWRPEGFTVPHAATYPWLWLWDSCFHAVVWAELGRPDRAVIELATALSGQDDEGFVPHVGYLSGEPVHAVFWGRAPGSAGERWSTITQPPVYGWSVAELLRRGVEVPGGTVERAVRGLQFLTRRRRRSPAGLVEVVHPWETGCDHSPRWDDLMAPGRSPGEDPYDEEVWFDRKGELLASVERSSGGAPVANPGFPVGSVAFTAVTAWAARELGSAVGDGGLTDAAAELAGALAGRWDASLATWVDDGPTEGGSGRARTAEALLGLLVEGRGEVVDAVVAALEEPTGLGGRFGPWGVDRREPTFRRGTYWRGPSWPQVDLLLWLGLRSAGREVAASRLATSVVEGAARSGWAESWDADDASPVGAVPQSWSTVAVLVDPGAKVHERT